MTFKDQLLAAVAEANELVPGYEEMVQDAIENLEAEFKDKPMLEVGDTAPMFSLPSATGEQVTLKDRLNEGPVILNFYRGGWCPYCNLELRAYQEILEDIRAAGASLIAISPQSPDDSLTTTEKEDLSFDVLSDHGCEVAHKYGIAFEQGGRWRTFLEQVDHALPQFNAADDWVIPLPATFVIGSDGKVKLTFFDMDYRKRLDPAETLELLKTL